MEKLNKPAIVIIGSGQLGSRHLQSLAKSDFNLFVVDPSEDSLKVAQQRFEEVATEFKGSISFHTQILELPTHIDVCIIATNSKVRAQVTEALLAHARVMYLVLEKVLFPSLAEYDRIGALLETSGTKAWVNCPRRMFPVYQKLREELAGEKIQVQISGNSWGLGCNGIHFLDLFAFLTRTPTLTVLTHSLDPIIHESKRPGYIEFTGTLTGFSEKGDTVSITSHNSEQTAPILIAITSPKGHYVIQQGSMLEINEANPENNWKWNKMEEAAPFQSQLTFKFVSDLLRTGQCELTSYEESAKIHRAFISGLLKFTSQIEHKNIEICQIT